MVSVCLRLTYGSVTHHIKRYRGSPRGLRDGHPFKSLQYVCDMSVSEHEKLQHFGYSVILRLFRTRGGSPEPGRAYLDTLLGGLDVPGTPPSFLAMKKKEIKVVLNGNVIQARRLTHFGRERISCFKHSVMLQLLKNSRSTSSYGAI